MEAVLKFTSFRNLFIENNFILIMYINFETTEMIRYAFETQIYVAHVSYSWIKE